MWQDELQSGEEIASCPSCSLKVRVIYDPELLDAYAPPAGEDAAEGSVTMPAESEPTSACVNEVCDVAAEW